MIWLDIITVEFYPERTSDYAYQKDASEVITMTKTKKKSTYDKFYEALSPQEKKEFDQEYKDLLLSELLIAIMKQDNVSVRKLAAAAGVSPTIIQGIRSGTR